jgi:carboxyl-terminal processing protease
MMKRILIGVVVAVLGVNLVIAARIYSDASGKAAKENPYAQMELITKVMELIRKDYVDADKTAYTNLTYGALRGMLSSLDPHSQFMDPQAYDSLKEETEGKFGGIGVQIGLSKEGFLTAIAPMEDSPAARAGILPGDRIVKIEGRPTEKMSLDDAVRSLRGDPGTKVTITIFRSKAKDPAMRFKDYTLTRAEIKVDSVKDVKMLGDGIGYIRITQFGEHTVKEFEKALEKLAKDGMDALVVDLRNNPGGLLEAARGVASKFIPAGQLIVSTEGRDPAANPPPYRSDKGTKWLGLPLVVLVNSGSASGSEIVAGALQDLHRAVLIGETTFGKGSVQSILALGDGSALRLTTAKYYTPSHKVIHEHGIKPDIEVLLSEEQERRLLEQRLRASLPPSEDGDVEKAPPVEDPQLDRAVDVLKGIKLYVKQTKGKSAK